MKSLTDFLRDTYVPLIHSCLPEGPPAGEMLWLVNKCGTQFNRVKRYGKRPITHTIMITQGIPHALSEKRWCGKFVNSRSGNVYYISFEVE